MIQDKTREFIGSSHRCVLATMKRDGRPQMSNMSYALDDDGRIKMSTRGGNVKVKNVRRDPRVSLAFQGDTFTDYLVVEGNATIEDADPIPTLRKIYEYTRGAPHPNWSEFDEAMRTEERVVVVVDIVRAYPEARLNRG